MSHVTNVILSFSVSEDREARLANVNQILKQDANGQEFHMGNDRDHWGGSKIPEVYTHMAALNFLDLDSFLTHLLSLAWADPEEVQVLVCEQESNHWRIAYGPGAIS